MELVIAFFLLLILLVVGIPVPFAFAAPVILLSVSLGYEPSFLFPTAYTKLSGVVLLAIPLFILAGGIMEKGKIGDHLVGFIDLFFGRVKGSLAIISVVASAVFGSICGSGAATLSCIGSILAPKMRENKYPMGIAASVLCCSAPLGLLIPPSAIQILYAWSGQLSILACFLSTVLPGIMLTILLSVGSWIMLRKSTGLALNPRIEKKDMGRVVIKRTKSAVPALLMPFIILGGIYGGFMTPTEAAAVSVIYAIPVAMYIYRGINLNGLKNTFIETATTTGVIMAMLALIMMLSRILLMEDVPDKLMTLLLFVSDNPIIIMLMINVFMVIIGMIMDDVSGTLLITPLLLPIVMDIGISPYHFAAILGVNLGMGNITPPTAPFMYLGGRICNVNTSEMIKPCLFLICFAYIPTLLVTTYVPAMATFLPELILGGNYSSL